MDAGTTTGEWLAFPAGVFSKEYHVHTTRVAQWIRTKTTTGVWTYSGSATLHGVSGKARMVRAMIEGKSYLRHRLIALAKDGTADGIAKFRSGHKNPVLHGKRRAEDARPDDRPENVRFGTHEENRTDPGNKKPRAYASGHPVTLTNTATGETETFASVFATAAFLGSNPGSLRHYLNGTNGVKNMPRYEEEGTWDAAYDGFELPGAVRLVRARAELYLSRERPNQMFRKLPNGTFAVTEFERTAHGYMRVRVVGGWMAMLHRLVVETLEPGAFAAKLAANPGLSERDLQVDHIDGDNGNNAIENLRVVTRAEHARKHAFAIEWIGPNGGILGEYECATDVVRAVSGTKGQPLGPGQVHAVCDGICKHTGGRIFRWKDAVLVNDKRSAKKRM